MRLHLNAEYQDKETSLINYLSLARGYFEDSADCILGKFQHYINENRFIQMEGEKEYSQLLS